MSAFFAAYLIVGVFYVLNDLFSVAGMRYLTKHHKFWYFAGCTFTIMTWFPVVILLMFGGKPNGPKTPEKGPDDLTPA